MHTPEVRAKVIAELMAGGRVNAVAKENCLDKSVVSRWNSKIPAMLQKLEEDATEKSREPIDFGAMLGEYLEELLTTAIEQQRHFRDKEWLNKQPADSLAVLHGVSIDKGIRLFEAARTSTGNAS